MGLDVRGLREMFPFDGYCVDEVIFSEDLVQVNLLPDKRRRLACPHCGDTMVLNRTTPTMARDLPMALARNVLLIYSARQGRCRTCHRSSTIHPGGIDSHRRVTKRLMRLATALAVHMSARAVSCFIPANEETIRRWDKYILNEILPPPDLDNLRYLMVDEKSIGKGHQYMTIVLNGDTGELLHIAEGKKKASFKSFFDLLDDEQKARIQAVCVDRGGAYVACVEQELPHAELVYDKFHLMMNLNHAVDLVRRNEWNKVRKKADGESPKEEKERMKNATFIKGQRFNLLRRPENNKPEQQERLDELLALNEPLSKAYILLDDFRNAISQVHIGTATRALKLWLKTAISCELQPIVTFAKGIKKGFRRVINAVRFSLNNGRMEGFNNLVARVIHKACGLHNLEYLTLKLRYQAKKTPIQPYIHPRK
jgi:transposase